MGLYAEAHSKPIIIDETCKNGIFAVDAYELSFLWTIVKSKPMSLYELKKQEFYFPKNRAATTRPMGNLDTYEARMEEPETHLYPYVKEVVKRLEGKGLVSTSLKPGPRSRRIVSPTFKGIIYFLQNEPPTGKEVAKLFENHRAVMSPLMEFINSVGGYIDVEQWWKALKETVWEFYELRKVRISIKHLDMTFEGYLENPIRFLAKRLQYMNSNFQKDPKMLSYLEKEEAREYRNAYIAYLALNDVEILSVAKKWNLKEYSPILFSEVELAQFEKREKGSNFLFDGERPKEFFKPKYCSLESIFVGMFIRNLLWGPIKEEQADVNKNEKTQDYKVEEID